MLFWHQSLEPGSKKLNEGIRGPLNSATDTVGWGVRIIEGPHLWNLLIYCLASLIMSLLCTALWGSLKHDMQGATGIGQYIVGVCGIMSSALFHRWSCV